VNTHIRGAVNPTESLTVELGERSYPIHFGAEAAAAFVRDVAQAREAGRRIAVVTDTM